MSEVKNFLPEQYTRTGQLSITHNYLTQQFADYEVIFEKLKKVVMKGDYTLGEDVNTLEEEFKNTVGTKYAIGVGSGTDALFLSLKALGVKEGDEVITTPFTFYATIGAIVTAGATPVFADVLDDYNIDPEQIKKKITAKTKVILPVHWSGKPCAMDEITAVAKEQGLKIVEDACHAIAATYKNKFAGSFGDLGCFSFHPLKNINVWGDGGIIATNSDNLADQLRLLRNHGLRGRDECTVFAYNSRLDTIQAVVASHLLKKINFITDSRIKHANYLDQQLKNISQVTVPKRETDVKHVYHLYSVLCQDRDALQMHLIENGIDAKVHYPIPMHLQPAALQYGYKKGDFHKAEFIAANTISLPVHEFMTEKELKHIAVTIQEFYS